ARYSSGKLQLAGAGAAAVFLIVVGLFGYQQWQLNRFGSQWSAMAGRVGELKNLQEQVRTYRPWFDDSVRGLSILKQIAAAFPEDGVVSAKTLEIRDLTAVTCTGVTRDDQTRIRTMDKLRSAPGIGDFHEGPVR